MKINFFRIIVKLKKRSWKRFFSNFLYIFSLAANIVCIPVAQASPATCFGRLLFDEGSGMTLNLLFKLGYALEIEPSELLQGLSIKTTPYSDDKKSTL